MYNIRVRLFFPSIHRMIYSSDLEFKENFIYDSINEKFIYKDRNELIEQILNNQPFRADLQSYQMLWIGRNDINGTNIYDKDIIVTHTGRICKVEWHDSPDFCGWDLTPLNDKGSSSIRWTCVKVIGNEYQMPDINADYSNLFEE